VPHLLLISHLHAQTVVDLVRPTSLPLASLRGGTAGRERWVLAGIGPNTCKHLALQIDAA